jgi:nuclear GTP-binding protein
MKHLGKKKSKRVNGKVRKTIKKKAKEHRKKMKKNAKKLRMTGRRPKKEVDIPNLWPWKEEMLRQKLRRMKDHDAEEERRKQINRKQQIRKSRQNMLLKALQAEPSVSSVAANSSEARELKDGLKNKKWYRRELNKLVETADVLIEVLDARDPQGCRCHSIEQKVISLKSDATNRNKRVILLINKIDLVPTEVLSKWIRILRREFPVIAFKSNTQTQKKQSQSEQNAVHQSRRWRHEPYCWRRGITSTIEKLFAVTEFKEINNNRLHRIP